GTFGGEVRHAEISTQDEMDNLPAEVLPPFVELDSLFADCDLLNDSETLDNEYMDFESQTDFSLSELLNLDNNSQFEEADVPRDLSGFAKDSCTLGVPEECATTSLQNNQEPTISSHRNVHNCSQCSQTEPAPDLSSDFGPAEINGMQGAEIFLVTDHGNFPRASGPNFDRVILLF
ncbi:DNA-binding and zinc-finger protein, partial [Trifolium medium]|nr:DNA-binding and zinc-finger protein [Trifolium medium]